jgi:hypothetical protein
MMPSRIPVMMLSSATSRVACRCERIALERLITRSRSIHLALDEGDSGWPSPTHGRLALEAPNEGCQGGRGEFYQRSGGIAQAVPPHRAARGVVEAAAPGLAVDPPRTSRARPRCRGGRGFRGQRSR